MRSYLSISRLIRPANPAAWPAFLTRIEPVLRLTGDWLDAWQVWAYRLPLTSPVHAGRASYLAEATLAGHNDPGAEAVALLFENIAAKSTA